MERDLEDTARVAAAHAANGLHVTVSLTLAHQLFLKPRLESASTFLARLITLPADRVSIQTGINPVESDTDRLTITITTSPATRAHSDTAAMQGTGGVWAYMSDAGTLQRGMLRILLGLDEDAKHTARTRGTLLALLTNRPLTTTSSTVEDDTDTDTLVDPEEFSSPRDSLKPRTTKPSSGTARRPSNELPRHLHQARRGNHTRH